MQVSEINIKYVKVNTGMTVRRIPANMLTVCARA